MSTITSKGPLLAACYSDCVSLLFYKVDKVLRKEGLVQLLDAVKEVDNLVQFASAMNGNKQLDTEHVSVAMLHL